ncbi:thioesterase domain-containing protein [Aureisphaera galaxeae]|uniref:thioesterase II family protein n=1 Tax=Aureisphaera galaxeae TaxID=1538023 RepID=UPI0023509EF4|nr:alpha/beta fold hydrolase [Aureisphaera galaxeae]MDC8004715.1 thioesterase domain-containing protein [Aureisphaera galaxeae]
MYPQAKKQCFLLHFAGGNSYSYNFLKESIDEDIEFISLELPGRGKRFQEDLIPNKEEAIDDYVAQIKALRNQQPYIIYGHSMGATLGLTVTKKMEEALDAPQLFLVSGNAGPGVKENGAVKRYLLNDTDFKKTLRELGGIPTEVLENDELYEFFSPIIRADFEVLEKDDFSERGLQIKVPIHAIMGDREETVDSIDNWAQFTLADFKSKVIPGNHFFIHQHKNQIASAINGFANVPLSF